MTMRARMLARMHACMCNHVCHTARCAAHLHARHQLLVAQRQQLRRAVEVGGDDRAWRVAVLILTGAGGCGCMRLQQVLAVRTFGADAAPKA